MVLTQEVFRLDARKPQHFRNLVERESLLTVCLYSDGLQDVAGHVAAGSR